jgi:FkbH-like protein
MRYLVYRNHTVEHLFKKLDAYYSGYGDIMESAEEADSIIWFYFPTLKVANEALAEEINTYFDRLQFVIDQNPSKPVLVFLLTDKLSNKWSDNDFTVQNAVNNFNNKVIQLAQERANIQFVSIKDFTDNYSKKELIDWKFYYISEMIISPKLGKAFNKWFKLKLKSLASKRKKCLVLDLDNTMWGGILGEDGVDGIQIGDTYPGNAFKAFQENVLEASKNGIILALCSKNNESDVEEAWEKNPFIVVKKEHVATYRINWQNKAANIAEIASELNIGLDSLVFIDDNPAERTIVKQTLPEVAVPDFPDHPYQMNAFFWQVMNDYFQIYTLTKEDKAKTHQYIENANRREAQKNFVDMDTFLSSLEMELEVQSANQFNINRIAQMTQKTNQFNLTTQRYIASDIQNFVDNGDLVYCLAVKDKFGDNGITVATIIELNGETAYFNTFLLSCRILGRGIENTFMYYLLNELRAKGIKKVKAVYIPSKKNKQTLVFYERFGFEVYNTKEDGTKEYQLELEKEFSIKDYYKFNK